MFLNHIVNRTKTTTFPKLGRAIQLDYYGFKQMLSYNGLGRRIANPWLVEQCASSLQDHNKNGDVQIESIYVERKSILKIDQEKRLLFEVDDNELCRSNPETLVATKAIIKMNVHGLNEDYSPSLAISLNSKSEDIAFGTDLKVCSNFTILSADRRFSTKQKAKNRKHPTQKELLEQINKLFPKTPQYLEEDIKTIEQLKQQKVTKSKWNEFIGSSFSNIHYVNRMRLARKISNVPKELKDLPITAALLADICAEALSPAHPVYEWQAGITNKWNCLNYGTEVIKAERGIATQTIIESNLKWTNLVLEHDFLKN